MKLKQTKIIFVKHLTPKSVVLGYFRPDFPRLSDEELLEEDTAFTITRGNEKIRCATVRNVVRTVAKIGSWGYCKHFKNKHKKEIHYWIAKKTNSTQVMELFAHEIAHAFGYSNEVTARNVGCIAGFAYENMKDVFDITS